MLEKSKVLSRIYTLFLVVISFVIFNAADMKTAGEYLGAMFGMADVPLISKECIYYLKSYGVIFILSIIGSTPLPRRLCLNSKYISKAVNILEPVFLTGLLFLITAYLVDSSFNPFLYFRF